MRAAILTGYAVVGAALTDLIAGPLLGAYSGSHFWPLLPCFMLINTIYFRGNGITQALTVLLNYFVAAGMVLGLLDWLRRSELEVPVPPDTEAEATAMVVPVVTP